MISVEEARTRVLALAHAPEPEQVALTDALGRAMIAPALARLTQPPFDASAMDGYALRSADLPGPLAVIGTAAAGVPYQGETPPGSAIRIFTGAPVPAGYDRVVMQEMVTRQGDRITVAEVGNNLNIRPEGNDFAQGSRFQPQRPLRPADLALLAAMNVPQVTVARRPRVAVLAGGDELVPPGTDPAPGQIISSNDIAIAALAREAGAEPLVLPLARDTEASLRDRFAQAEGCDLIVTIGGASVGDHDLAASALAAEGMTPGFWKIAMRPGKPLMVGRLGDIHVLGLPGNPVSSLICAHLFLRPLLARLAGREYRPDIRDAILGSGMKANDQRRDYVRAAAFPGSAGLVATPFDMQDSSMLGTLAAANALIVREPHAPAAAQGAPCRVMMIR